MRPRYSVTRTPPLLASAQGFPPVPVTINKAVGQADPAQAGSIVFDVVFAEPVRGFDSSDVVITGTAGPTSAVVRMVSPAATINDNFNRTPAPTTDLGSGWVNGAWGMTLNAISGQQIVHNVPGIHAMVRTEDLGTPDHWAEVDVTGQTVNWAPEVWSRVNFAAQTMYGGTYSQNDGGWEIRKWTSPSGYIGPFVLVLDAVPTPPYRIRLETRSLNHDVQISLFTVVNGITTLRTTYTDVAPLPPGNQVGLKIEFGQVADNYSAGVLGSGAIYTVTVTGMSLNGNVIASIPAGVARSIAHGAPNLASTSTDNSVAFTVYDTTVKTMGTVWYSGLEASAPASSSWPTYTQAIAQNLYATQGADYVKAWTDEYTAMVWPTKAQSITDDARVVLGPDWMNAYVTHISLTPYANVVTKVWFSSLNVKTALPAVTVTINKGASQSDPTAASPIIFDVVFSEAVTGFATGDVTLSGTASAGSAVITGSGTTYTVTVSGMTGPGTVVASIAAGVCVSSATTVSNNASTSTDNSVDYTGSGVFNLVTAFPWAHLYYPAGPAFQALALANGAAVTSWVDEIAANAAALTAGSGTYRPADVAINSVPSVENTGSAVDGKMHPAAVAVGAQVAVPYSIICIQEYDVVGAGHYAFDGANDGNSGNRTILQVSPFASSAIGVNFGGVAATGGSAVGGINTFRLLAAGASGSLVTNNGATVISGLTASAAWQGLTLGGVAGAPMDGRTAAWGIMPGVITAQPNWAALQAWVLATFGKTLS